MKKVVLFSILLGVLFFGGDKNVAFADAGLAQAAQYQKTMIAAGYTCSSTVNGAGVIMDVSCTKTVVTYSATQDDAYTLTGTKDSTVDSIDEQFSINSPFIYFSNPPQGNISVTLNSTLNSYLPQPSFNAHNGWDVTGNKQKGTVSIDGKEQKKLFYELAMNSVTLNRHGQNFSSKEKLASYLQNSDFFNQLGFSTEQKENSFQYVLQKLNDPKVSSKYYYLTILTDESVADISILAIQPKPKKLIRSYFAIYPTNVPVKKEGSFMFPQKENLDKNNFTVKETGEFVIPNNMTIFFK